MHTSTLSALPIRDTGIRRLPRTTGGFVHV